MNLRAYADPTEMPASEAVRVARLLAIDGQEVRSDVQLAQCVSGGLFPRAVTALANVIGRWTCCPRGDAQASAQGQETAVQGDERTAL